MTPWFHASRCWPLLLSLAAASAQAADWPQPSFPTLNSAQAVEQACAAGLRRASAGQRALERRPEARTWLLRWQQLQAQVEDDSNPPGLLLHVHPQAEVRAAAEACDLRWQAWSSSLAQSQALYRGALKAKADDEISRRALQDILADFAEAGIGLRPSSRARVKVLSDHVGILGQDFDRRLRDDKTRLPFTDDELAGVPRGVIEASPRDAQGRVLVGLDYPSYFPVMDQASEARTRELMWRASNNRGGDDNLKAMASLAAMRHEMAQLLGHASYAELALRRRMAQTPAAAIRFLDEVAATIDDRERRDLAELREAKGRHLGLPADEVSLQRWDLPFYAERLRQERYQVDAEQFRNYFPPQESLQFVMRLAERLFGVRYERVEGMELWHADAQAYRVSDAATGQTLAGLIVDLYPREGKYGHAAVFSYRRGSTALNRLPQAALVVNFDRRGLTLEELGTLLHEFGHSLHSNLSQTRWLSQSGTSVPRDFVEAPSQMLEDWVFEPQALDVFKEVCPSCQPVPAALMAQARQARGFNKGVQIARQHLYASYDLALHGKTVENPMALWARMEGATPLGHVADTKFPAGFSHVAGGYAAGYYGYLWSLVVAVDLRTAFEDKRLDPAVGQRYRRTVLSQGGQKPPAALVQDFLGRPGNPEAFFKELREP